MMMPGSPFSNPTSRFKPRTPIGSGPTAPNPGTTSPTPTPHPGFANYSTGITSGALGGAKTVPTPTPTVTAPTTPQPQVSQTPQPQVTTTMQPNPTAQTEQTPQTQDPKGKAPGLQDVGSLTSAGASATGYNNSQADTLGQDNNYITDAGRIYRDRVTKGLQGDDPLVKNAQATEDTAASRRQYMANQSTGEALGQSHFAPGSAQYQRAMDKSQAGVDAANQEGQSAVNDYTRKRTAENMAAAQGLETQAYNRNEDKYGRAVKGEDVARANAVGERTHTDTRNDKFVQDLPEGKAKMTAAQMTASGKTPDEIAAALYGPDGKLKPEYVDATPGQDRASSNLDDVTSTFAPGATYTDSKGVTQTVPGTSKDDPAYKTWAAGYAQEQGIRQYSATNKPVQQAGTDAETQRLQGDLNQGSLKTEDFAAARRAGLVPDFESSNLPIDAGAQKLVGKTISLGGKQVKVVAQGRVDNSRNGSTHASYVVVQTPPPDNKVMYNYGGQLTDKPPRNLGHSRKDGGKYAVYDPNTKSLSYQKTPA